MSPHIHTFSMSSCVIHSSTTEWTALCDSSGATDSSNLDLKTLSNRLPVKHLLFQVSLFLGFLLLKNITWHLTILNPSCWCSNLFWLLVLIYREDLVLAKGPCNYITVHSSTGGLHPLFVVLHYHKTQLVQ